MGRATCAGLRSTPRPIRQNAPSRPPEHQAAPPGTAPPAEDSATDEGIASAEILPKHEGFEDDFGEVNSGTNKAVNKNRKLMHKLGRAPITSVTGPIRQVKLKLGMDDGRLTASSYH